MKLANTLCAVALGEGDALAFAHALRLSLTAQGLLRLIHVDPRSHEPDWQAYPHVRDTIHSWGLSGARVKIEKGLCQHRDPAQGLVDETNRKPTDLVVAATHAREGVARWVWGSVCESLLRSIQTPVLALPPGSGFVDPATGAIRLRRILAPASAPPGATRALNVLGALLDALDVTSAQGRLLHVRADDQRLEPDLAERTGERVAWQTTIRPEGPDVEHEILREVESWSPDLIVMTTRGPQGLWQQLMGSVTERVLRGGHCAVLAVPATRA